MFVVLLTCAFVDRCDGGEFSFFWKTLRRIGMSPLRMGMRLSLGDRPPNHERIYFATVALPVEA